MFSSFLYFSLNSIGFTKNIAKPPLFHPPFIIFWKMWRRFFIPPFYKEHHSIKLWVLLHFELINTCIW